MSEGKNTMGGEPDVKRKFVDEPREKALQVDRVKGGRSVVNASSNDPAVRFGVQPDDIFGTKDLDKLLTISRESESFKTMERKLKSIGVHVTREVSRLEAKQGGGTTVGNAKSKVRGVIIWPEGVFKGFHVLDIFIHEYGHVYEDNGGPDYQTFLNTVQDELGIRRTPDSHRISTPPGAPSPLPTTGP